MPNKASVIAIINQKGGVGKTTSVVNLASYCALGGRRVLIVDNDPQGNASSVFSNDYQESSILEGVQLHKTSQSNLSILSTGKELAEQESRQQNIGNVNLQLKKLLSPLRDLYDLIVIDCPPSASSLSLNALVAADWVLIPLQCEYYALEGMGQLLQSLADQEVATGRSPALAGILLTMHDPQFGLGPQVAAEVRAHFKEKVFSSIIPRDIALAAAPSHGQGILNYDPLSPGSLAYLAAAKELLHVIKR